MLLTATGCSGESANPISLLPMRMVRILGIIRYFHCYRKSDIDGLIEQAGWEVVNRDELSPMPGTYFVAARKQSGTVVACTERVFQPALVRHREEICVDFL